MQLPVASTLYTKALKAESRLLNEAQPLAGGVLASSGNSDLVDLYDDIKAMDVEGIFASPDAAVWGESHPANVRCVGLPEYSSLKKHKCRVQSDCCMLGLTDQRVVDIL